MQNIEAADLSALEARLGRVERENRRLRHAGGAAALAACVAVLMGQAEPTSVQTNVEARRIALVGDGGKVRAELGVTSDGDVRFDFYNDAGGRTVSLTSQGPFLGYYDDAGVRRVGLMVDEVRGPYLSFKDKDGKERVALVQDAQGPRLTLSDEAGAPRATLGSVQITEEKTGKVRDLPPSTLKLFDRTGKAIFTAPVKD